MIPTTPRNLGSFSRSPPASPTHQGSPRGARVQPGLDAAFSSLHVGSPALSTRFSTFSAPNASGDPFGTPPNSPHPAPAQPTTPRAFNPRPAAGTPQTPSTTSLLSVGDDEAEDDDVWNVEAGPAHQSMYPFSGWLARSESDRVRQIFKWAMATKGDNRDNADINKVHPDYWVPTDVRKDARNLVVLMIFALSTWGERVCDLAVDVNVGQPETQPEYEGGPCLPDQVTVLSFSSRYAPGISPDARFAQQLGRELFKHGIAVPHAAKFPVRKRHLMKNPQLRNATARPIPNGIETWRFVAAPIVPALSGVAQIQDIVAENTTRVDARKRWIARNNGHSPSFGRVVKFLADNNVRVAVSDAILDMLCSVGTSHHPADDWYYLFTKHYGLPVPVAVALFNAAINDATAESWPF